MHHCERLPAEAATAADPVSGLPVTRLTGAVGHSHALYFTTDSLTPDGRYVIHASERGGANELWACDLRDHALLRLTDAGPGAAERHAHQFAALAPAGDRIACWRHGELTILDLASGELRCVHAAGAGEVHGVSWTADGRWILTCVSGESGTGNGASTADRLRWLAAPPLSRVIAVAADGSGMRVLHEERWLITHVNASPTDPDLCTFCHEGPWLQVPQRIWGLRVSGGAPWPILRRDPAWGVGHEYWLEDGRTIGFHARHAESTWRHAAGFVDALSGESWLGETAVPTHHAVAVTRDLVIFDGTRASGEYLMAVRRLGDGWDVPRVICRHDSSRHHHRAHVHPRLCRDGRTVIFTSDQRSYSDVCMVRIPDDPGVLPPWPGKPVRYYWE